MALDKPKIPAMEALKLAEPLIAGNALAFDDFAADVLMCASSGRRAFCVDRNPCIRTIESGLGPLCRIDNPRDDGLAGFFSKGTNKDQPHIVKSTDDPVIRHLWDGRLGLGFATPIGELTTFAVVDLDCHGERIDKDGLECFASSAFAALVNSGISPRYIAVSSTDAAGKSGGLHFFWVFNEPVPKTVAAHLAKWAWLKIMGLAMGMGIEKADLQPWVDDQKITGASKLSWARFPRSIHAKHPHGSKIVTVGERLDTIPVWLQSILTSDEKVGRNKDWDEEDK